MSNYISLAQKNRCWQTASNLEETVGCDSSCTVLTADDLAGLLYIHARSATLSDALSKPGTASQLTALGRWVSQYGYVGAIPEWFLEEARAAHAQAWSDQ